MIASIASSFTSVAPALASRATGGRRAARGRNNIVPVFARQTVTEASKKVKNPPGLADLPATTNVWGLYGAVSPFENGFDPLGLATKVDFGTLKRYREAELTHGRVCMLAALGILAGEAVEGSSFLFDAQITGPAIDHFAQVPRPFWIPVLFFIGAAESSRVQKGWADPFQMGNLFQLREDYTPGDLGFDPFGYYPKDNDAKLDLKMQELNNGRLAMMSVAIMVAQEVATGQKILEFWGIAEPQLP